MADRVDDGVYVARELRIVGKEGEGCSFGDEQVGKSLFLYPCSNSKFQPCGIRVTSPHSASFDRSSASVGR